MPSIRFRLEKPSLTGLAAQVRREYGPNARILDTEEHIVGGIGGFFGRRVIDVLVEAPDAPAPAGSHAFDLPKRAGIMALLDDADAADFEPEFTTPSAPPSAAPVVSTQSGGFATVLDALRIDVEEPPLPSGGGTPARPSPTSALQRPAWASPPSKPAARAAAAYTVQSVAAPTRRFEEPLAEEIVFEAAPRPLPKARRIVRNEPPANLQPGDLILLAGLGDDAVRVAASLREALGRGYVCDGGSVEGHTRRRVDDRRGALAARAYGVRSGQPVLVAWGLGDGDPNDPHVSEFATLGGDRTWVVVDATRKTEDTLRWVNRLRASTVVDAVASIRTAHTSTPDTLDSLGLPEAWSDASV